MIWKIIYNSGKTVDETQVFFNEIDKNDIKVICFFDGVNSFGFDLLNYIFFINNEKIDLKIKGSLIDIFQYKSANYSFITYLNNIKSWNIGFELFSEYGLEKYTMSIFFNGTVFIEAKRNVGKINEEVRKIRLR